MPTLRSFYDVVVLGTSLPALATGALLARRGFRVAVLGHHARPHRYEHEGVTLYRGLSSFGVTDTPAFRRVLSELAILPVVRRRLVPCEPAWQVVMPGHRLDVSAQPERWLAEVLREFPEVPRAVEDFQRAVLGVQPGLDALFGADVAWPPDGFWERRAVGRLLAPLPFGRKGVEGDLFAAFAAEHPFRTFVAAQARFATDLDPAQMTSLQLARLHATGLRGAFLADGGVDGLRRLLEERVQQHGGDIRPRDAVERIIVRRGAVKGVVLSGLDEAIGCAFVVTALDAAEVLRLAGEPPSRGYQRALAAVRPAYHRYALNVVVPPEAVPPAMGPRVFAVMDPSRPLVEENLLAVEVHAPESHGAAVTVTVEVLLARATVEEGDAAMHRVRGRILRALETVMPFLSRHVRVVDSPHDGLPLEDRAQRSTAVPAARIASGAEPMDAVEHAEPAGALGVCALPATGDVRNLLLVGRQVAPGLGAEGSLLAALSAARHVTRSDRSKERMRRELWSKVDA